MRTKLDNDLIKLMKSFEIDCYHVDGNVKMKELGIDIADPDEVIEFDDFAVIDDVGIIFETTVQQDGNKKKINDFFYHKARSFIDTANQNKINYNAFSTLSRTAKTKLKKVKHWKCVYIGTSNELLDKQLTPQKFPNSSDLLIINSENFSYLNFLSDRLQKFGKSEFFKQLNIEDKDKEAPSRPLNVTSIKLENKKISGNVKADVFIFQAPAFDLLKLSLVPRYGSLNSSIPEYGDDDYQRLLDKKKLRKIAQIINNGKGDSSFPNAITVVLADDVKIVNHISPIIKEISIPNYYGSLEVIDGQHRLFGYAHSNLSKPKLSKSKIMVLGLKFHGSVSNRRKQAAKIFFEINREQTKVHNDLLYLLSFPVLGELTPRSLSSRLISILNTDENGPLQNVFSTRPFLQKNRSGGKPVKIVMVANELSKLFNIENKDKSETKKLYDSISKEAWGSLTKKRPKKILEESSNMLTEYFKIIQSTFKTDWTNKNSLIFSSKYMMGFTRLFIEYKKRGYVQNTMGRKVAELKTKLTRAINKKNKTQLNAKKIIFSADYEIIPSLKEDQTKIANFILKYGL